MTSYHTSVLLKEAIDYLNVKPGEKYIDATLGGGGHTQQILELGGIVLGIDVDQEAIDYVQEKFETQISKFKISKELFLARGNFKDIKKIAFEFGFEEVSGILFDLGVSSHQFDAPERGFSFQKNAQLDMRMDTTLSVTAADLVNALSVDELTLLFEKYGEETFAKKIARAITAARKIKNIETTHELAGIITKIYPRQSFSKGSTKKNIHPATKVFQALRIAVNDEMHSFEQSLPNAYDVLKKEGRLVVISFHSLEDRIVKSSFANFAEQKKGEVITKKPYEASYEEVEQNKRSRSAKLRVFEKN